MKLFKFTICCFLLSIGVAHAAKMENYVELRAGYRVGDAEYLGDFGGFDGRL